MIFLSGPRQVGKTTLARSFVSDIQGSHYFNWDNHNHRVMINSGPEEVAQAASLNHLRASLPICAFDEIHKYKHWRDFLKGFFDQYEDQTRILVTGSASLNTFRRGGDSLMGRYFPYTIHPLSVAELSHRQPGRFVGPPSAINEDEWDALWNFGGFPEPYLKSSRSFHLRWQNLRTTQLLREDLRDLTRIQELDQVEMLADLLRHQVGHLTSYSSQAKKIRVSVDTIRRWISTLEALYYCFTVKPWHRNVARALRKEPKYYLWDWSQLSDEGARAENLVASALLKAVHFWTETGQGECSLHFVRDKQKREVDFLVVRDDRPWFLVEVKTSAAADLSPALTYFQAQTGAEHAFQVAIDANFVERDCFELTAPTVVPGKTLLAQLV